MRPKGTFDVPLDNERTQLEAFIEEYRGAVETTLDGLTKEQARRRLVPSATTLLGLLKHVTWMQRVWFEECVAARAVDSSASRGPRRDLSRLPRTTPSPRPWQPTGRRAPRHGQWSPICLLPATVPDRARCAGCTCKSCGNCPTNVDTTRTGARRLRRKGPRWPVVENDQFLGVRRPCCPSAQDFSGERGRRGGRKGGISDVVVNRSLRQ